MKKWSFTLFLLLPFLGFAQNDSLLHKLDSLRTKEDTVPVVNVIAPFAYDSTTNLNFKTYFILEGSNLKQSFTKPFHMTKKDWGNVAKFAVVTGALMFTDEPIQRQALKLKNQNTAVNDISSFVTKFGGLYEGYALVGLGAYGFIFKNQKVKTVTLLATQAYITTGAVETVIKFLAGRTRPVYYDMHKEAEPKFLGPFSNAGRDADGKKLNSSFPSGHTAVAFAAATVFASEYKNQPLIPIVSYGLASLIGLSRITENKHWFTDVVAGAALGFVTGKQVVNNYHRYADIRRKERERKTAFVFNVNFTHGHLEPGLIVKFY